jgi:hypothetical protein
MPLRFWLSRIKSDRKWIQGDDHWEQRKGKRVKTNVRLGVQDKPNCEPYEMKSDEPHPADLRGNGVPNAL